MAASAAPTGMRAQSSRRSLGQLLRDGFRAAFAVGPGYEPQPLGELASFDGAVRGYFLDLRAKTETELQPFVTGRGTNCGITPTMRAQRALGLWERHLRGDRDAATLFLALADELLAAAESVAEGLLWRYEVAVPKYNRRPPWYSCMAQGQGASVLVRAHLVTRADDYATAAVRAIRPLTHPSQTTALVTTTSQGPILEECPTDPPSHILNGWIYALWGLYDVGAGLDDEPARLLFESSARALGSRLGDYDLGWWSLYSLYPGSPDLATPFYHRIQIAQLEALHGLTGDDRFRDRATRWRAFDRLPTRARVIARKAAHALMERGAREA